MCDLFYVTVSAIRAACWPASHRYMHCMTPPWISLSLCIPWVVYRITPWNTWGIMYSRITIYTRRTHLQNTEQIYGQTLHGGCSTASLTRLSEAATPLVRPNCLQWPCPGSNHRFYERGPHIFVLDKNLPLKLQPLPDLILLRFISPGS